MSDEDLLTRYADARSNDALAELVSRYLPLVYSVARRCTGSASLAEDVAQLVFIDLARQAARLRRDVPLVAWLHTVTQRTARDFVRGELRRKQREAQAAIETEAITMHSTARPSESEWREVEPLLDEAISSLDERDRAAVIWRFFQNRGFREIGAALGISDDAAQKRVSRALEQLRGELARRGVTTGALSLASGITAHAMQPAPPALGATICAQVAKIGATAAAGHGTFAALTGAQKTIATAAIILALGAGVIECAWLVRQRTELRSVDTRLAQLESQLSAMSAQRDAAKKSLADTERQLAEAQAKVKEFTEADTETESELGAWLERVSRLRQALKDMPQLNVPELQLATTRDWLNVTRDAALVSEMDMRAALCGLRQTCEYHLAPKLFFASQRYLKAHQNEPPASVADLAPYFDGPVDPAILSRYAVYANAEWDGRMIERSAPTDAAKWLIRAKEPVDPYYDSSLLIRPTSFGTFIWPAYEQDVRGAVDAYRSAHGGADPQSATQLQAYLPASIDPAYVTRKLERKF